MKEFENLKMSQLLAASHRLRATGWTPLVDGSARPIKIRKSLQPLINVYKSVIKTLNILQPVACGLKPFGSRQKSIDQRTEHPEACSLQQEAFFKMRKFNNTSQQVN